MSIFSLNFGEERFCLFLSLNQTSWPHELQPFTAALSIKK